MAKRSLSVCPVLAAKIPDYTLLEPKKRIITNKLNKIYAIVSVGGHKRIIQKHPFKVVSKNEIMDKFGDEGLIWLGNENRETYKYGIGVYPKGCKAGIYNLWQPFKTKKGSCYRFIEYIHSNICGGKYKRLDWLLDWLADLIQNPESPKGCAIVIKGSEGLLEDVLETVFKQYTKHQCENLTHAIVVKTPKGIPELLTAYHLVGHWLGVAGLLVKNMTHQVVSASTEWQPPKSIPKHRWLILEQSYSDNDKVMDELQDGGIEAFVYLLQHREITHNLSKAPKTPGSNTLKPVKETNFMAWWTELVIKGKPDTRDWIKPYLEWPKYVKKGDIYLEYRGWCDKIGVKPISSSIFNREIRIKAKVRDIRISKKKERHRLFVLPRLKICRMRVDKDES